MTYKHLRLQFTLKRLPQTVYKKVMGKEMQLDDLKDVQPQLFRGLQQLLDFDGDVEGTFCLTFQVNYFILTPLSRVSRRTDCIS